MQQVQKQNRPEINHSAFSYSQMKPSSVSRPVKPDKKGGRRLLPQISAFPNPSAFVIIAATVSDV